MKFKSSLALLFSLCIIAKSPVFAQAIKQWEEMKAPTQISFASSNIHFAQDSVPNIILQKKWIAQAWRGEKINTQLLVWSREALNHVSVKLSDLKSKTGEIILAKNLTASFLSYTKTDGYFGNACGPRINNQIDSSLVADIIDTLTTVNIKAKTVQPLWIQVNVPQQIAAGSYSGYLTVYIGKKVQKLPIQVEVSNRTIPLVKDWSFDLDLWQHPAAIARIHQLPLWSDAHFKAMKPYYTKLAAAGQKVITASIVNEPWGHQTYDDFPSLIKWTKLKDGSWKYDYSLFDQYIAFVMECGINKNINCYTMVSWNTDFKYFDETLGKDATMKLETNTPLYNAVWTSFLKDFTQHLKAKNWFEITRIAMDERPVETMLQVIKLLKSVDPKWKIALAGNYHQELVNDIDDYAIFKTQSFTKAELENRIKLGQPTTYYTSCEGEFPNLFTFSAPAEAVWMAWFAQAKGFTGYLRWAYNSWTKDPLQDSRFTKFPAGDTFQIYPGPRSSVRFEKLIEGIQDFEKIHALKIEFTKANNQEALQKINALLAQFDNKILESKPADEILTEAKKELLKLSN